MYRPSPLRYKQRPNGFKVKHVLQICLVLAVLFWLIYQFKNSHEGDERTNLGRKDIGARVGGKNNKPEVKEENTGEEVEDDSETDQQDLDKLDPENDEEEDLANEEETALENEALETDSNGLSDEEHYKADDASSAVTHINQITSDGEIRKSLEVENAPPNQEGSDQQTIAPTNKSIIKAGEFSDYETESSASVKTIKLGNRQSKAKKSDTIEYLEKVQHDAIGANDSANSLELKDVRTDLDTLPQIQTEGTYSEDIAAD